MRAVPRMNSAPQIFLSNLLRQKVRKNWMRCILPDLFPQGTGREKSTSRSLSAAVKANIREELNLALVFFLWSLVISSKENCPRPGGFDWREKAAGALRCAQSELPAFCNISPTGVSYGAGYFEWDRRKTERCLLLKVKAKKPLSANTPVSVRKPENDDEAGISLDAPADDRPSCRGKGKRGRRVSCWSLFLFIVLPACVFFASFAA